MQTLNNTLVIEDNDESMDAFIAIFATVIGQDAATTLLNFMLQIASMDNTQLDNETGVATYNAYVDALLISFTHVLHNVQIVCTGETNEGELCISYTL